MKNSKRHGSYEDICTPCYWEGVRGEESSASPACSTARRQALNEITEVIAGHAAGHNNTPEKWRENAELIFSIVERSIGR